MPTTDTKSLVAYSYLRFSTPEQIRGDSFRRQTTMAQEYASRHGLLLDDKLTFQDLGVSAFRGKNADAGRLGDFQDAVRQGLVPTGATLLVESLDRLSRQAARRAMSVLNSIVDLGVAVVTLTDGRRYDAETLDDDPMALMFALVTFIRANDESATKSRRLKASWQNKRQLASTRPLTARAPAWIVLNADTRQFELIPDRAAIVRQAFEWAAKGLGQEQIAQRLNERREPTFGEARFWHRSYIKKMLEHPAADGILVPHEIVYVGGRRTRRPLEPVPHYYPRAVEAALFQQVAAQRSQRRAPSQRSSGVIANVLAGLAVCPSCGASMTRVTKGSRAKAGRPYLVCTSAKAGAGCHYKSVPLEDVQVALSENASFLIGTVPSGEAELDNRLERVEASIHGVEESINRLLDEIRPRQSTSVATRLRTLENELERLQQDKRALITDMDAASGPALTLRLGELEAALSDPALNVQLANAALRRLARGVVVDWRQGRLHFEWKHGGVSTISFRHDWGDE
jgi:DNA invertase Pin-like site-specific DNA recombinase